MNSRVSSSRLGSSVWMCLWSWAVLFATPAGADGPTRISSMQPGPAGTRLLVSGDGTAAFAVEGSSNLVHWRLLTNRPATSLAPSPGTVLDFTDTAASGGSRQFYRLRQLGEDLSLLTNRAALPSAGFGTVQFAPDGRLAHLVWKRDGQSKSLHYRERLGGGLWTEEPVAGDLWTQEWTWSWEAFGHGAAALVFDGDSQPHLFVDEEDGVTHRVRRGGTWERLPDVDYSRWDDSIFGFTAATGPDGSIHLALLTAPSGILGSGKLVHAVGSPAGGGWIWTDITTVGNPNAYYNQSYAPRFFSMAVDSLGGVHIVYAPSFVNEQNPDGTSRPFSELGYASNATGLWEEAILYTAADRSGDAGLGCSIAIGPDDLPAVAAFYVERAHSGSPQGSRLMLHRLNAQGIWTSQTVLNTPDGYAAGDGRMGTGFAPHLLFDHKGRPHIAFSDHASQHFDGSGADEFAGQLRHAYHDGTRWVFRTVFRQSDPIRNQIVHPVLAMSTTELVFTALVRTDILDSDLSILSISHQLRQWFEPMPK